MYLTSWNNIITKSTERIDLYNNIKNKGIYYIIILRNVRLAAGSGLGLKRHSNDFHPRVSLTIFTLTSPGSFTHHTQINI